MQSKHIRTTYPLLPVQPTITLSGLAEWLRAHTLVLLPVAALVVRRAVLHQLAAAANQAGQSLVAPGAVLRAEVATLDTAFAATLGPAQGQNVAVVREADVALDPVAHLLRTRPSPISVPDLLLRARGEYCRGLGTLLREPNELAAIVCAAGVRAAAGKVVVHVRRGDE